MFFAILHGFQKYQIYIYCIHLIISLLITELRSTFGKLLPELWQRRLEKTSNVCNGWKRFFALTFAGLCCLVDQACCVKPVKYVLWLGMVTRRASAVIGCDLRQ